jgi:hypothetical protein
MLLTVDAYREARMANTDSLLDLGNYPEIYADGVGDMYEIAANSHFLLFRWRMMDGVLRRCLTGEIIRPTMTMEPAVLAIMRASFPRNCQATMMH